MADLKLWQYPLPYPAKAIAEELAQKISKTAGVTLQGNHLTIRWGKKLKQVHCIIVDIDDGEDEPIDWELEK